MHTYYSAYALFLDYIQLVHDLEMNFCKTAPTYSLIFPIPYKIILIHPQIFCAFLRVCLDRLAFILHFVQLSIQRLYSIKTATYIIFFHSAVQGNHEW